MTCSIYHNRTYNKARNQWRDTYVCYMDNELFSSLDCQEVIFDPYRKTIRPVCLDDTNNIPLVASNRVFHLQPSLMNESLVGKYNVTHDGHLYWLHPKVEEGVQL